MHIPPRYHVDTSAGRVAFMEAGAGPDVVLIHGALVTADDMALALFGALAKRFHVVAFDRPGHGGTDQTETEKGSSWKQAEMLRSAARMLGLHRPTVVGHSFGGAVALATAMLYPDETAGVVGLAPICFPEPRLEQMLLGPRAVPVFGSLIAQTAGASMDLAMLPLLRRTMFLPQAMPPSYEAFPFAWASRPEQMVADAKDGVAMWSSLTRSALSYARCKVRVAILGGTHDLVVGNGLHGRLAAQALPRGRFDWVPGAGHMLHHFHQARIATVIAETRAAQTDLPTAQAA